MAHRKQIFHTEKPTRWKAFKWSMRVVTFLVVLSIASFSLALFKNSNPEMPKLGYQITTLEHPEDPHDFNKRLKKKHRKANSAKVPVQSQVRAAFFVNWDRESFVSLKGNISKLNMVIPEWLFLDSVSDNIIVDVKPEAFALMDTSPVKILPLLTNDIGDSWRDSIVNGIIASPVRRTHFISQILSILKKYGFDGISVDFEELGNMKSDEYLIDFHHQLYDSLHAHHYLATQCIPPYNEDYRLEELHKFNDYIFVMAYDQHFPDSKPGPVCDDKWVEKVLDYFTADIDPGKFVLCVAGYGYDWSKNKGSNNSGEGQDVTYQEALAVAKENQSKVIFDDNGYNLHYDYQDEDNNTHQVWFTDAATDYNMMRTAAGYGLAGVALWRLGSEDPRLWSFYEKNLSIDSLDAKPFDISKLNSVKPSNDVDYIREGEVLEILTTPQEGKISTEYDDKDQLISEETYLQLPTSYVIKKFGKAPPKTIILTFDDGPDPKFTNEIIDILKSEKVPAAFFMVGVNMQSNIPLVKKIYDDGFEIGDHTFTHPNLANETVERARLEMNGTRRLLEIITGHSTVMFRPPYNADAEPQDMAEIIPVEESWREHYITIGESVDPQDWDENINADSIFNRVISQEYLGSVILLHDAGGNRSATVEALPRIIKYYKDRGYHFGTIAELLGKTKNELMPAVTNPKEQLLNKTNFIFADTFSYGQRFIYGLFFIGIFLSIGRMIFMGTLASIKTRKSLWAKKSGKKPLVSIIVPAYNEHITAVKTIANLLQSDYPDFEVIFINDGSKDNTFNLVQQAYGANENVRIYNKPNGGKASALNLGIEMANGDFVVCIDADTQLEHNAVSKLMESFVDDDFGAVAGNVKVGNQINMLTRWQSIEYITAQNFDRKAFDLLNCITVVPGAIGAFRKTAIQDAGGFTPDSLAEDCDLTIRIIRSGYIVTSNQEAIAMTEAPETLKLFLRQRFRWCFGIMQSFWKHRDACFNTKYGALGWIALPNILIFQIFLPFFAPLADILMMIGIFSGNAEKIGIYYLIFQLVDLAGAILAFSFEKENIVKLWMLLPQRFTYRWLMYYVLFKAIGKAMKGELQSWGVLKRTGNVTIAGS